MSRRAQTILSLVVLELVVAVVVFMVATTHTWKRSVHGRNDDFRGSYWALLTSVTSSKRFYRACRSPNVSEYLEACWPEHMVAAVATWLVWYFWISGSRRVQGCVLNVPCPRCGYDIIVQVQMKINRCPECGALLADLIAPAPPLGPLSTAEDGDEQGMHPTTTVASHQPTSSAEREYPQK